MAFIARSIKPDGMTGEYYFNVSHSVGAGGKNYWTDIMLVQYLISKIYLLENHPRDIRALTAVQRNSLPDPMTDYKNLKLTEKWIRIFQEDLKITVDGRIDMAKGTTMYTNKLYTIWGLHDRFHYYYLFHDGDIKKPLTDPDMPLMLKNELKKTLQTSRV